MNELILQKGYSNNDDYLSVFIKKNLKRICIISVYVDDLNIIENTQEAHNHRKYTEFEMKDLGKTKFYLDLQLKHILSKILIY